MSLSPLSRFAAPLAIVAGALVIVTRLVTMLTVPAEIEPLKAYVLTTTHAVNSILSIVAFALLAVALVAVYELEAREADVLGAIGVAAAIVGTVFMAGDWWYEAFAVPRLAEVAPDAMDTFVGGRLLAGGLLSFVLFGIGWLLLVSPACALASFPGQSSIAIVIGRLLLGVPIGLAFLSVRGHPRHRLRRAGRLVKAGVVERRQGRRGRSASYDRPQDVRRGPGPGLRPEGRRACSGSSGRPCRGRRSPSSAPHRQSDRSPRSCRQLPRRPEVVERKETDVDERRPAPIHSIRGRR